MLRISECTDQNFAKDNTEIKKRFLFRNWLLLNNLLKLALNLKIAIFNGITSINDEDYERTFTVQCESYRYYL